VEEGTPEVMEVMVVVVDIQVTSEFIATFSSFSKETCRV
jgi:hypothetical protein